MINFDGLLIGIVTFLIIGLFHPVVVKAEYYWGTKCWWIFLVLGILGVIASLFINEGGYRRREKGHVRYLRRIRLFIVLDDQGDFRAGGACAERLVPSKSEKKIPLGR